MAISSATLYRLAAEDLFMLCRRASYAISKGNHDVAAEILSHAVRIAGRVDIKDRIIKDTRVDLATKLKEVCNGE